MQRYNLEDVNDDSCYREDNQMVEDPQGEWVRWEDVEHLLEEKEDDV